MPTRSGKPYQDPKKKRKAKKDIMLTAVDSDTTPQKDIENNINVSNTSCSTDFMVRKHKAKHSLEKSTESNWIVSDVSKDVKQINSDVTTMDYSMTNTDGDFVQHETTLTTSTRKLRNRIFCVTEKNEKVKKNKIRDIEACTSINNLEMETESKQTCGSSPRDIEYNLKSSKVLNKQQKKKQKKMKNSDKKKEKVKSSLDEPVMPLINTFEKDKEVDDMNLNNCRSSTTNRQTGGVDKDFGKKHAQSRQSRQEEKEITNDIDNGHFNQNSRQLSNRTSDIKNITFEKLDSILNTTYEKDEAKNTTSNTNEDLDENKLSGSSRCLRRRSEANDTTNVKKIKAESVLEKDGKKRKSSHNSNDSITNRISKGSIIEASPKCIKRRISGIKDITLEEQSKAIDTTYEIEKSFDKTNVIRRTTYEDLDASDVSNKQINRRQLDKKYAMSDKQDNMNTTYEKDEGKQSDIKDNSEVNVSYNVNDKNDEFDKSTSFAAFKKGAMTRKSCIIDTCEENKTPTALLTKENLHMENILSSSASKRKSIQRRTIDVDNSASIKLDLTFEKMSNTESASKSQRLSKAFEQKLNTTFDKDVERNSKSSLISSDNSVSSKYNLSRISITSDETEENILINTTPLLIESSMDESNLKVEPTEKLSNPETPLKREGTFTKDVPEVQAQSPPPSLIMPTAGCTPYHISKSSQKKTMLNVTRSIEKRMSGEPAPRMTRVMFCSPVDNPAIVEQEKRKIIKSNLKGSNKSFVFSEDARLSQPRRKRSYTHSEVDDMCAKRSRLTEDLQNSVNRLSRPRTASATGHLSTPKKTGSTPSKSKSESKSGRTRLPNFGALHQKEFAKMESLDEFQERKAKRARQMLTASGSTSMLERISPKSNTELQTLSTKELSKSIDKTDTPTKKPTTEPKPGYTKFGFKLNLNVNPFSVPPKTLEKSSEIPRKALPSLTGTTRMKRENTLTRREAAKSAIMREKSNLEKRSMKRDENRTIIKGVRTNRRFELQMKLRNIN